MSQETTALNFTESINASASKVYDAFINAGLLRQWLCTNSQVSARKGGRIYLYWQQGYTASGEFTKLNPNEQIAFSWQGKNEPFVTQIAVSLTEEDGKTAVSLTHSEVPTGADWETLRSELKTGWESGLANLKSVLETGLDKRIYDQPFLGILIGGVLSEEQAKEQNLPIAGGILINNTVPDTGAAAVGLQNGDVLVNLGGTETTDFNGLREALRPFKAGESVKITYFREGEKESQMMALSHRPQPDVPETAVEAAKKLNEAYATLQSNLQEAIEGVTDEVADFRPADDEWNIKEVLTHLIYTERFSQANLAAQMAGNALDGFPNHPPEWIKAMTVAYPSISDMAKAWHNSMQETVAIVENLPDDFIDQKVYYLNTMNTLINGLPGHTQSHIDQIKELVKSASEK